MAVKTSDNPVLFKTKIMENPTIPATPAFGDGLTGLRNEQLEKLARTSLNTPDRIGGTDQPDSGVNTTTQSEYQS
jgi:hypothetical protein